ncbi:hypothetical protein L6164_011671 [Bauhinia variegata]|uniref:Uncharacterized protein n=1 Tax=Bauhinia variegata TaxID=167791 RepID=A0ACB9P6M8_BAUVA|nr:hypothetical protein L6164_011671 [Bauhinia variegata]
MVDLLVRPGQLHEAWDLIGKMPEKPDHKVIFRSLLGACRRLKAIDIGERVMQLLLELDPSNSGNYFISKTTWKFESAGMRMLMKQRGVAKTTGSSWIDIENQLHAGDALQRHSIPIYEVLDLLYEELKREGYVPKTDE